MPFHTPITWTAGQVVTAANLNEQVRDNINAIRDEDILFETSVPAFFGAGKTISQVLTAPPAIGATTPNTGKFTTLQTTGDAAFGEDISVVGISSLAGALLAASTATVTGLVTAKAGAVLESALELKGISTPSTPSASSVKVFPTTSEHLYVLRSDGLTYPLGPSQFWLSKVQKSATQSINSATLTTITFDQETHDSFAMHDNVTNNSRITVPRTGYYEIKVEIGFAANATGQRGYILLKNAAEVGRCIVGAGGATTSTTVIGSHIIAATANEYFEIQGYQTSGGALNVLNSPQTYFTVRWIGAS